jgi:hypothetical protein
MTSCVFVENPSQHFGYDQIFVKANIIKVNIEVRLKELFGHFSIGKMFVPMLSSFVGKRGIFPKNVVRNRPFNDVHTQAIIRVFFHPYLYGYNYTKNQICLPVTGIIHV